MKMVLTSLADDHMQLIGKYAAAAILAPDEEDWVYDALYDLISELYAVHDKLQELIAKV